MRPAYIASAAAFVVELRRRADLYRFWARRWLRDPVEQQHARIAAEQCAAYAAEIEARAGGNLDRSLGDIEANLSQVAPT